MYFNITRYYVELANYIPVHSIGQKTVVERLTRQ